MLETELPIIRLKTARAVEHPWIFSAHIDKPETPLRPGTLVQVQDAGGRWLAYAHYNGHARTALRVLSTQRHESINGRWFDKRVAQALALRKALGIPQTTDAYRLIHAEGDQMSGVIVDRFADVLVTQFFSAGMYRQRAQLREALEAHIPNARHYWFADKHISKQESFDCPPPATPEPVVVSEHGMKFLAAPGAGHKTGFFADQRENRWQLAQLCEEQSVLDLCCNSGGFGIYAAALGNAAQVTSVDLDSEVIALAKRNAELNQAGLKQIQIDFVCADLFDFLKPETSARKFGVVVLDPAKMTRSADQVREALQKYYAMNRRAIAAVKSGGWLLTCSCTGRVSEDEFIDMLRAAAAAEKRQLQIVRVSGAGADHPVLAHVPESRYLKAVFARVLG